MNCDCLAARTTATVVAMVEKQSFVTHFDDLVSKIVWAYVKCINRHMFAKPKGTKDENLSGLAETALDISLQARIWHAAPHVDYQTAIDPLLLIDARNEAQNKIDNA
jgi:hypothetical protein